MPYRIPKDKDILNSINNVMNSYGVISSQTKLKELVERDLHESDPTFRVSPKRLRILALSSDDVSVEIHCRESEVRKSMAKCPVCNHKLKLVKNKTLYDGVVIIGHECTHCSYWTGMKRRIPIRYVFSAK